MTSSRSLSAIVLIGGASRRFGSDKAAEVVAGRSLLQHVVDVASELAQEIVVVGARRGAFPTVDSRLPLKEVEDVRPGTGALGGLYSGLLAATHAEALAMACDMPLASLPLLRYLRGLLTDEWDVVMPRWQGREEPLHAVLPPHVRPGHRTAAGPGRTALRRFPAGGAGALCVARGNRALRPGGPQFLECEQQGGSGAIAAAAESEIVGVRYPRPTRFWSSRGGYRAPPLHFAFAGELVAALRAHLIPMWERRRFFGSARGRGGR